MQALVRIILFSSLLMLSLNTQAADYEAERAAIHRLIDQYGTYQAEMDAIGMSKLMSPTRAVLSSHYSGRRTDNVLNMKIQQAQLDIQKKEAPGIKDFIEDRERLIEFFGDGKVAVASFFRHFTRIYPAGMSAELKQKYAVDPPLALSLVLEKRGNEWIIVHTHASELNAAH